MPVLVGSALAYRDEAFRAGPAAAALAGAILIQVGTNLANDYYDHRRGVDSARRIGPPRASAQGWIPASRILFGAALSFLFAALVGVYLIAVAGWPILAIGVASLASGYAYTGGPYPLGYHGWGDLFVFVFFGLVAVAGTYFVQAGSIPFHVVVAAVPVACLSTAILVVNNLRDLDSDAAAGKRTLAVRIGARATRAEYALLLVGAYASLPLLVGRYDYPPLTLLPWTTLPLGFALAWRLAAARTPHALIPLLGATALLLVLFGIQLAVAVTG